LKFTALLPVGGIVKRKSAVCQVSYNSAYQVI